MLFEDMSKYPSYVRLPMACIKHDLFPLFKLILLTDKCFNFERFFVVEHLIFVKSLNQSAETINCCVTRENHEKCDIKNMLLCSYAVG